VSTALHTLQVERVDHGVRSEEDADLMQFLIANRVPLTVCPLSNLKLCVVDDMQQHNLARMLRAGVCVTVNSDDPAYFGGYMNANYIAVADDLALTQQELYQLASNSFQAAFVSDAQKAIWQQALLDYHSAQISESSV
jgi:adenine deaminase